MNQANPTGRTIEASSFTELRPININRVLYLTGGLVVEKIDGTWQVGPVVHPEGGYSRLQLHAPGLQHFLTEMDLSLVGHEDTGDDHPLLPTRVWTPREVAASGELEPADQWSCIASAAHTASDPSYIKLARSVSSSLRACGLQLRNLARQYVYQLQAKIHDGPEDGARFSNLSLTDIQLSLHALAAELASLRDFLSLVAAKRVGAPDKIDSLGRLKDWVSKSANQHHKSDQLVSRLLDGYDEFSSDPWLFDLGEYRNTFLHKLPLAAHEVGNKLETQMKTYGPAKIFTVRYEIELRSGQPGTCDALERFFGFHQKISKLADFSVALAKYAPEIPSIVIKDVEGE